MCISGYLINVAVDTELANVIRKTSLPESDDFDVKMRGKIKFHCYIENDCVIQFHCVEVRHCYGHDVGMSSCVVMLSSVILLDGSSLHTPGIQQMTSSAMATRTYMGLPFKSG